jgi:hypothetical protein
MKPITAVVVYSIAVILVVCGVVFLQSLFPPHQHPISEEVICPDNNTCINGIEFMEDRYMIIDKEHMDVKKLSENYCCIFVTKGLRLNDYKKENPNDAIINYDGKVYVFSKKSIPYKKLLVRTPETIRTECRRK